MALKIKKAINQCNSASEINAMQKKDVLCSLADRTVEHIKALAAFESWLKIMADATTNRLKITELTKIEWKLPFEILSWKTETFFIISGSSRYSSIEIERWDKADHCLKQTAN